MIKKTLITLAIISFGSAAAIPIMQTSGSEPEVQFSSQEIWEESVEKLLTLVPRDEVPMLEEYASTYPAAIEMTCDGSVICSEAMYARGIKDLGVHFRSLGL